MPAVVDGGEQLQRALRQIARKLSSSATLRVGFLEGATYPNGTPVAMVAAIQNYGAPKVGIPPRPFFTNMVRKRSRDWAKAIRADLQRTGYDVLTTLGRLGLAMEGQLRQSIIETNSPPLSQKTIDRKGFDKPLIDSSHMINSVGSEVKS